MSKIISMKAFVPWCYVADTAPGTHEEFRALLGKWRPSALLIAIAQLSVTFGYGPENETTAKKEAQDKWIKFLFKPKYVPVVQKYAQAGRIIFFQGQLRYLASEVIRQVPLPSEDLPPPENDDLGELLFRAGELLYQKFPKLEDKYDQIANNVARFLPIYEIDSPIDGMVQFLRFYIMLMHIDGRVEGSIALPGQTITVRRTGQTEALLTANEIVVLGQVRGNCQASDHLDIRSEGSMSGNAVVSRISIADGAFVKGNIDVRRA